MTGETFCSRRTTLRLLSGTLLVPFAGCGSNHSDAGGASATLTAVAPSPTPTPTAASTAQASTDTRARYHVTASDGGWINDPQRPIRTVDGWTLWALYNPTYPDGGTSWRRWTSTDLVTWQDRGVAIPRGTTRYGDVWSGSTVRDSANTAGFGAGAIIALATMPADNAAGQNQSCALWYSLDEGASFNFHAIVLPNYPGNKPFRDPTVFWHDVTRRWIMTLSEEGKIGIYASLNLKEWRYAGGFVSSIVGAVMECSHLFRLHLFEADGTTTTDKWVLMVGGNGTAQGFTVGTYYWTGTFDGTNFIADAGAGQWLDQGADYYAAVAWIDPQATDPLASAYTIGWMNNWDYANQLVSGAGYRGQLSVVRRLTLQRIGGSPRLCSAVLPGQNTVFPHATTGTDQVITEGADYVWPTGTGIVAGRIDLKLTRIGTSWPTGAWLSVRGGGGYFTQIGFQLRDNIIFLKRDTSGPNAPSSDAWQKNRSATCDFTRDSVTVSVLSDTGSIEVFVNGDAATLSELITAPTSSTELHLNTAGGSVRLSDVSVRY